MSRSSLPKSEFAVPKPRYLLGMGKYSFMIFEVIEDNKNMPRDEQERMAQVVRQLVPAA